jgi:hypothetical protein
MKAYYLLFFCVFSSFICKSQKYSFPLYFVDSAGNRDTLYFGEDPSATFGIDEQFGEVNLINKPFDSTFEVFFTDAVSGKMYEDFDCYLGKTQTPTYISKKQFNDFHFTLYRWIELGIITKNWPVKISWNQEEIRDYVADQGNSASNMFMYSWNPPASLVGDVHCCGYWPNSFTILNDTSQVVVTKNNFCHYTMTISKDSVNLFFINYSSFTGIAEIVKENLSFRYDPKGKAILYLNSGKQKSVIIEVCDLSGRVQITKTISSFCDKELKIDAGSLSKGIYIIRASSVDDHSHLITQKIQVL